MGKRRKVGVAPTLMSGKKDVADTDKPNDTTTHTIASTFSDESDEETIHQKEKMVQLQSAATLFDKAEADALNTLDLSTSFDSMDDLERVTAPTRTGGYQYDMSVNGGGEIESDSSRQLCVKQSKRLRREPVYSTGDWDATESLGLCKVIDLCTRRIDNVDVKLASLLIPTRSKQQIVEKLKTFKRSYDLYNQRRLDRTLRTQTHSASGPPPPSSATFSHDGNSDDDDNNNDNSNDEDDNNNDNNDDNDNNTNDNSNDEDDNNNTNTNNTNTTPTTTTKHSTLTVAERRAALDRHLASVTTIPINITQRCDTLDAALERQTPAQYRLTNLERALEAQLFSS